MHNPFPFALQPRAGRSEPGFMAAALSMARLSVVGAAAVLGCLQPAAAASLLNSATDFAVLGATTVTSTPSVTSAPVGTRVYGALGVSPGTAVTGFPPGTVTGGSIHLNDAVAVAARADATLAYSALGLLGPTVNLTGNALGSMGTPGFADLSPGVYAFDTSASIDGQLTLDFAANPTGSFVFLIGSTLTTGTASLVSVLNGSSLSSIYWRVGSSATLGSGTNFAGNILANTSISMNPDARISCGRAIALTGAVTMIGGSISNDCNLGGFLGGDDDFGSRGFTGLTSPVPEPASALMLAAGMLGLTLARRKSRSGVGAPVALAGR